MKIMIYVSLCLIEKAPGAFRNLVIIFRPSFSDDITLVANYAPRHKARTTNWTN